MKTSWHRLCSFLIISYQTRLPRFFVLSFALLMATLLVARFFTTAQAQATTVTVDTTSLMMDGDVSSVGALLDDPGLDKMIWV